MKKRYYNTDDKTLVIKPIEGVKPRSTSGLVDSRIFTGKANVHAKCDRQTNLWGIHYAQGILPQPLRQKFTTYSALIEFVDGYFRRRGLYIAEVIENEDEDSDRTGHESFTFYGNKVRRNDPV